MGQGDQLKLVCDSYIKRTLSARQFDLTDFCSYMEPFFVRKGFRDDEERVEAVLVIRLDDISDVVLTTGFLRELRKNYPQAHISLVVNPLLQPLMELCPYVDEVLEFASEPGTALQNVLNSAVMFCYRFLWKRKYSLCFCPRWDVDESWALLLGYMSGAKERIGYSEGVYEGKSRYSPGYDILLTKPVMNPPQIIHEAERNFYLLQSQGLSVRDDAMELWFDDQDKLTAHQLLMNFIGSAPMVVVALGAQFARRRYPVEKYVAALRQLAKKGVKFVLLGSSDVGLEGRYFVGNMPRGSVLNLIGQAYIRVMAAILAKSDMYIGNDTGLAQMASALGIPVIEVVCEAEDKSDDIGVYSRYERYFPWKTPAIVLRPEHALAPCHETAFEGGCCTAMPHCITKVDSQDLVTAYAVMKAYLAEQS